MEATVTVKNVSVRDNLISISEPANPIIARLKSSVTGEKSSFVSGYSRMHNRHNRS